MALFHLTAKIISRGKGQSAIAAAAYRSGERLYDEAAGETKHYRARSERIVFTDIMAPKDAPEWAHDRNELWNHAERAEKRKDAQLAREIEIALPHELTEQQREWLVKDFARAAFVRHGYAVDIAIHAPDQGSDERNHHAHLLVTRRTLWPEGFAKAKDWKLDKTQLQGWREQWEQLANRHLERHGHAARIDHRSLEAQGIEREPGVHLGYAANEMAQRGGQSDRWDELQGALARNDIRIEMKDLDRELAALEASRSKGAPARGVAEIAADHKAAEAEAARTATLRRMEAAARADDQKLSKAAKDANSIETAFAAGARSTAAEMRQERREEAFKGQQEAWRTDVAAHKAPTLSPGRSAGSGLRVMDGATGAVSGLADFVSNLIAGASPSPASRFDAGAYVTDPAARREQQLARLAAREAAERDQKAILDIMEHMDSGRDLRVEDICALTRDHQELIHQKGDDGVRQLIEEARKRSAEHWKGSERERD